MIKRWHVMCSVCDRLIDRFTELEMDGNNCSRCGGATYLLCCGATRKVFFGLVTLRCKEPVSESSRDHFCSGCGGDQRPIKRKYPNIFTIDGEPRTLPTGTFEDGMVSPAQIRASWPPPPPPASPPQFLTSPIEEQAAGLMPDQEPTKEATIEARIRQAMEKQDDDILFDPRDV